MAIQVVKCKSCNMFYDAGKFDKCPYCGKEGTVDEGKTVQIRTESTNHKPILPTMSIFDVGASPASKEELNFDSNNDTSSKLKKMDSMYADFSEVDNSPVENNVNASQETTTIVSDNSIPSQPEAPVIAQKKNDEEIFGHIEQNLNQQIKTNNDGKTIGFFSTKRHSSSTVDSQLQQQTGSQPQPTIVAEEAEPFAGWLVCIKGPGFAKCFKINVGRNSIGRDDTNHIVVSDDPKISRSKHCWLTYEPKHRTYMLQPGDSSGLTYLNDEYVTENKTLTIYDKIEIGDTVLMFIPLCGEKFSWEDYLGE